MRALVHIGMPKTGTTALQTWLYGNRRALASMGVVYDPGNLRGTPTSYQHRGIALCYWSLVGALPANPHLKVPFRIRSLADLERYAAKYEAWLRRVAARGGDDLFLVSSEFLGGGAKAPTDIEAFDRWLSGIFSEVTYVVYFRRQEEAIVSGYSQSLKQGSTKTLDQYAETFSRQDWFACAENWARAVGEDRLHVRLLEKDCMRGGDLFEDFVALMGVDKAALAPAGRSNPSLSAPTAEVMRAINRVVPPRTDNGHSVNWRWARLRKLVTQQELPLPRLALSRAQIQRIRNRNAESNEKLRARFFPGRDELFPEKAMPAARGPARRASAEDVAASAADLLATAIDRSWSVDFGDLRRRTFGW